MSTKQINDRFLTNIQISIIKQLYSNNEIKDEQFNYAIGRLNKKLERVIVEENIEYKEIELICYKKRKKKYERDNLCSL